jgi:hypothetical protein
MNILKEEIPDAWKTTPEVFLARLSLFTELAAARALYGSSSAVSQQPTHPLASKNKRFDSSAAHAISPTKLFVLQWCSRT